MHEADTYGASVHELSVEDAHVMVLEAVKSVVAQICSGAYPEVCLKSNSQSHLKAFAPLPAAVHVCLSTACA